jgi:hypothetical protein
MVETLDCLVGFVGVDESTGDSGLYLTSLPLITVAFLNGIAPAQGAYKDMMKGVESRTIRAFRTKFTAELNRCFKVHDRETVESLICENKELLAEAFLLLYGSETLSQALGSQRINRTTTLDLGRVREIKAEFDNDFMRELSEAVSGLDITKIMPVEPNGFISVTYTAP